MLATLSVLGGRIDAVERGLDWLGNDVSRILGMLGRYIRREEIGRLTGPRGERGLQGSRGDRGERGLKGDKGDRGLKGDKGDRGLKGDKGDRGLKGDKGDRGLKGEQGLSGAPGITQIVQIPGQPGKDGRDGLSIIGPRGLPGVQGLPGRQGVPGKDGKDGNNGKDGKDGKDAEVKLVDTNVRVFQSCEITSNQQKVSYTAQTVKVIEGTEAKEKLLFDRISALEGMQCLSDLEEKDCDCYAAVPDYWLLRPEHHRPQMIIQFGEDLGNKIGSPKYEICIPHAKPNIPNNPPIPGYRKGNYEMILVLADNSKVTVNAYNEAEATKVINAAKALIVKEYLNGSYAKGGYIQNKEIAQIKVKPKIAKYFPDGRKSEKPEWLKRFT